MADALRGIESQIAHGATFHDDRHPLLPRLISGELRVPDAEKVLEESV